MTTALNNLANRLRSCRGVLVDSNVLLDVATNGLKWADWSARALAECADCTALIINPIVYAEVSIGLSTIEALDAALPLASWEREALPWEAGSLAGKAFLSCHRRGGQQAAPLPDFYIGAHAVIERLALLTRDAAPYRTCFPKLEILGPAWHPGTRRYTAPFQVRTFVYRSSGLTQRCSALLRNHPQQAAEKGISRLGITTLVGRPGPSPRQRSAVPSVVTASTLA